MNYTYLSPLFIILVLGISTVFCDKKSMIDTNDVMISKDQSSSNISFLESKVGFPRGRISCINDLTYEIIFAFHASHLEKKKLIMKDAIDFYKSQKRKGLRFAFMLSKANWTDIINFDESESLSAEELKKKIDNISGEPGRDVDDFYFLNKAREKFKPNIHQDIERKLLLENNGFPMTYGKLKKGEDSLYTKHMKAVKLFHEEIDKSQVFVLYTHTSGYGCAGGHDIDGLRSYSQCPEFVSFAVDCPRVIYSHYDHIVGVFKGALELFCIPSKPLTPPVIYDPEELRARVYNYEYNNTLRGAKNGNSNPNRQARRQKMKKIIHKLKSIEKKAKILTGRN